MEGRLATVLLELARTFHGKELEPQVLRALNNFLRRYVRFSKRPLYTNFVKELNEINSNADTMGLEEQILDITFKEGKQEGKQEGITQGKLEGITQGKHEQSVRMAMVALEKGLQVELIAELSGLTTAEVTALKASTVL